MNIIKIPTERRYWLIRAGTNSGEFYEQFRLNGVVAVGHANNVAFDFEDGHELTSDETGHVINAAVAKIQEDSTTRKRGEQARLRSQLTRFLTEVNVGDTVITLKESSQVVVGSVTSKPYYAEAPLYGKGTDTKVCEYNLRINVQWGTPNSRDLVPLNLEKTFRIPNTIAEFKDPHQVRTLNHWLYPIYFVDGEVRCSLRIASEDDLSNRKLTMLSQTLDKLDLLSSYIEYANANGSEINWNNFDAYINSGDCAYGLKAQHLFMSPGYQFIQLSGSDIKLKVFAAIYTMMFNSADVSAVDLPQGMDRHLINSVVAQIASESEMPSLKNSLQVSLLKKGTNTNEEDSMGITLEDTTPDSDPIDGSML